MATAFASLPRSAGNGAALVVVVADFLIGLFATNKAQAAPRAKVTAHAYTADKADTGNVWQLYRLGAGSDSVSPQALAKLQKLAVQN